MASDKHPQVDNQMYDGYGERWYSAEDDPVALLRAEGRSRNPWILSEIRQRFSSGRIRILDIGCGAGFLANELVRHGFAVTGLDASEQSLEIARRHDPAGTVDYRTGDATRMEFEDAAFEAACAMDFLEHVEDPARVVREIARVLKPGGLFFFHTFNRNLLSWLVVIKGVEWFVRNTPANMHCLRYFIRPAELRRMCRQSGMDVVICRGFMPDVWQIAFWRMLATGRIDDRFRFHFIGHTLMGYTGLAVRRQRPGKNGPVRTKTCENGTDSHP